MTTHDNHPQAGTRHEHDTTAAETGLTADLIWLRRAQQARDAGLTVDVRFRLDDGTPVRWRVAPGEIRHDGFYTPNRFFVAFRAVDGLRQTEGDAWAA